MSIISLIVVLVVIGVALWAIQQIPMDNTVRAIIRVVVILFAVLWLLSALGLLGGLGHVRLD
jgi:hypothetical protein